MSQNAGVGVSCFRELRNSRLWNDKEMDRRLWTDVAESESRIIFIDDIRWNLLPDDLVEESLLVSLATLEL